MKSSSSNRTQLEQTASDCLQAWKYDIFFFMVVDLCVCLLQR